ncbi:hypothetical protein BJX99DRAFT_252839 [Aspergillus californicus]
MNREIQTTETNNPQTTSGYALRFHRHLHNPPLPNHPHRPHSPDRRSNRNNHASPPRNPLPQRTRRNPGPLHPHFSPLLLRAYNRPTGFRWIRKMLVQRPILLKQKALAFYRPGAYALGEIIAELPWKLVFILYSLPIYWMVEFQQTAARFFTWLLALYMGLVALGIMFRAIAVFTTSATRAAIVVGLGLNVLIIYTGGALCSAAGDQGLGTVDSPIHYTFESMMVNEIGQLVTNAARKTPSPRPDVQRHGVSKLRSLRLCPGIFVFFAIVFFGIVVMVGIERARYAAERTATVYYKNLPGGLGPAGQVLKSEKGETFRDAETSNTPSDVFRLV